MAGLDTEQFVLMKLRLYREIQFSRTEIVIALVLLELYRPRGVANPSNQFLCKRANVSLSTVKRTTARLVQLGYFQVKRGNDGYRTNHYEPGSLLAASLKQNEAGTRRQTKPAAEGPIIDHDTLEAFDEPIDHEPTRKHENFWRNLK